MNWSRVHLIQMLMGIFPHQLFSTPEMCNRENQACFWPDQNYTKKSSLGYKFSSKGTSSVCHDPFLLMWKRRSTQVIVQLKGAPEKLTSLLQSLYAYSRFLVRVHHEKRY